MESTFVAKDALGSNSAPEFHPVKDDGAILIPRM
jgi:hypothetical protein